MSSTRLETSSTRCRQMGMYISSTSILPPDRLPKGARHCHLRKAAASAPRIISNRQADQWWQLAALRISTNQHYWCCIPPIFPMFGISNFLYPAGISNRLAGCDPSWMLRNSPQSLSFLFCHFTGKRSLGSSQTKPVSPLAFVPSYFTVLRPLTVSLPTLWQVPPLLAAICIQSEQAFSTSPVRKKL